MARDQKTAHLLELVSQYERLCNDRLRTDFSDGFFALGRANYLGSARRRFGVDALDLRPHAASITVQPGDEWAVRGRETERAASRLGDKLDKDTHGGSGLRNRKERERAEPSGEKTTEVPRDDQPEFDPLLQFGALVPMQLRQSQRHFVSAIDLLVEQLNVRRKIEQLVDELEL